MNEITLRLEESSILQRNSFYTRSNEIDVFLVLADVAATEIRVHPEGGQVVFSVPLWDFVAYSRTLAAGKELTLSYPAPRSSRTSEVHPTGTDFVEMEVPAGTKSK